MSLESKGDMRFREIEERTPFINNRMDMTVSENSSIQDSTSAVTKTSEVGSDVRGRLMEQKAVHTKSNHKPKQMTGQVLFVASSHRRLKKSWLILGCLIGFLIVVCAWYLFAEIKARIEAYRIKKGKERDARVKKLYDEFIGPLDDCVKIVREGAEVFEAKKTPVGISITASNTQNIFLLQNEVTYQPDFDGRRMYFTFFNGRIEFEYDKFSWYYRGRLRSPMRIRQRLP